MSNDLIPFNFKDKGQIRCLVVDGKTRFCAADATKLLGYGNGPDAIAKHVKPHEKSTIAIRDSGPANQFILLSGLLRLVLRSRMPDAEEFQTWLVEDVVPSIMKTGAYVAPGANVVATVPPDLTPESVTNLFGSMVAKLGEKAYEAGREDGHKESDDHAKHLASIADIAIHDAEDAEAALRSHFAQMEPLAKAIISQIEREKRGHFGANKDRLPKDWDGSHKSKNSLPANDVALGLGFKQEREWSRFAEDLKLMSYQQRSGDRDAGSRQADMLMEPKWEVSRLTKEGLLEYTGTDATLVKITALGRAWLEYRLFPRREYYDVRPHNERLIIRGMILGGLHAGELSELREAFLENRDAKTTRFTQPRRPMLQAGA